MYVYIYLLKYENEQYAYVQYILVYKNKSTHFRRRENIAVLFLYTSSSPVNLIEIDTAQKYFWNI